MKTLTLILAITVGLFAAIPNASAGGCSHRTRVTYCGDYEVHYVYKFIGHDCHGCAIYRWVEVRRIYRPSCDHGHGHGHGGLTIRFGR